MSKWALWGYDAHLVLEIDGKTVEILDPLKPSTVNTELDTEKILRAISEFQQKHPPGFREVTFDAGKRPQPSESWKNCLFCSPRTACSRHHDEAKAYYANV